MSLVRLLWDQLPTESVTEYHAFRAWLGFAPGSRELPVKYLNLAAKHRWTERAEHFDRSQVIESMSPEEQLTMLNRATPGMLLTAQRKYQEQLADSKHVVTARDLKDLAELHALAKAWEPKPEVDISALSIEERKAYRELKKMERKLLKTGGSK